MDLSLWLKMTVLLLTLPALLLGLRRLQQQCTLHPEWMRKLAHLGGGLLALSLPWLFSSPGPVLLLCLLSSAFMWAVTRLPALRSHLGMVTGSVARTTWGEVLFPLGVAAAFWLAGPDRRLYTAAILVLTCADGAAALIGVRWGARQFPVVDGSRKSVEGSAAFACAAFLSIWLSLAAGSQISPTQAVATALIAALLLAGLEALSPWGSDNLLLPPATCWLVTQSDVAFLLALGTLSILLLGVGGIQFTLRSSVPGMDHNRVV